MTFVSVPDDTAFGLAASGTAGEVDVSASLTLGTAYYDVYGLLPYHAGPYYKHYWYNADDATVITGLTNIDGCGFDFQSIVIDVGFPFCCADVLAEVMFTCEGFEYADFTVEGIQFPNTPWFSVDATIEFTMGLDGPAKSISSRRTSISEPRRALMSTSGRRHRSSIRTAGSSSRVGRLRLRSSDSRLTESA
jgi:hypothetical protein